MQTVLCSAAKSRPHPADAAFQLLSDSALMSRVRDVVGLGVGNPLGDAEDAHVLQSRYRLKVRVLPSAVRVYNDQGMEATIPTCFPDSPVVMRLAACAAVASAWTPTLGHQTRQKLKTCTPSLMRWFGRSQVVDAQGFPLVVFRGESSNEHFHVFDRRRINSNAFFFTTNKDVATIYANGFEPRAFYLKAERVLDLTSGSEGEAFIRQWAQVWDKEGWIDRLSGEAVDPVDVVQSGMLFDYEGTWSSERWLDLQASIEHAGFDGAILPDFCRRYGPFPAIVVFEGKQVKSATDNTGVFDPKSLDVYD